MTAPDAVGAGEKRGQEVPVDEGERRQGEGREDTVALSGARGAVCPPHAGGGALSCAHPRMERREHSSCRSTAIGHPGEYRGDMDPLYCFP